jgi:hypothetical protein
MCRSPIKAKKHVVMDVCQSDGFVTRSTVSKASAWRIPTLYSAVRKLSWGGIVPILPLDETSAAAAMANTSADALPPRPDSPSASSSTQPSLAQAISTSPMARGRSRGLQGAGSGVRRDLVPERREKRKVFGEGEGPQTRFDRNRLHRGEGEELYDYVDSDEERLEAEDETLNDPELMGAMKELEGFNAKVKRLERVQELKKRLDSGEELSGAEAAELEREEAEQARRKANGEEVEKLGRYEDLDEESKRLLDIPDEDWQDWLHALEGDEEKGRDLSAFLGKKMGGSQKGGSGKDEDEDEDEEFDPISGGRVRGRDRPIQLPPVKRGRAGDEPAGDVAGSAAAGRGLASRGVSSSSSREKGKQKAKPSKDIIADDIEQMKNIMGVGGGGGGRGGGRRKPAVARGAAALRRSRKDGDE